MMLFDAIFVLFATRRKVSNNKNDKHQETKMVASLKNLNNCSYFEQ